MSKNLYGRTSLQGREACGEPWSDIKDGSTTTVSRINSGGSYAQSRHGSELRSLVMASLSEVVRDYLLQALSDDPRAPPRKPAPSDARNLVIALSALSCRSRINRPSLLKPFQAVGGKIS